MAKSGMRRKHDPEFIELIKKSVNVDPSTGVLKFNGLYASLVLNIAWKGHTLPVQYSNVVWLISKGDWPKDGFQIDHINNDPLDNRPDNLMEVSHADNQKKRRGRLVYRSYGRGEFGHGINLHHDKRDNRFYVRRYLSRGHGNGDLKGINKSLGGFDNRVEALEAIRQYIEDIKQYGEDYFPEKIRNQRQITIEKLTEKLRGMRKAGKTIQQISDETGISFGTVYKRVKDLGIDNRLKP